MSSFYQNLVATVATGIVASSPVNYSGLKHDPPTYSVDAVETSEKFPQKTYEGFYGFTPGLAGTVVTPAPATYQGRDEETAYDVWYDRVYTNQEQNGVWPIGFVSGASDVPFNFFNAWSENLTLTNVTYTGSTAVVPVFDEPRTIPALAFSSGVLRIDATTATAFNLDGTLQLTFQRASGGTFNLTLDVTASAGTLFEKIPDTQTLNMRWKTSISTAGNGREIRRKMRQDPILTVGSVFNLEDGDDRRVRENLLRDGHRSKMAVGFYLERTELSAGVNVGESILPLQHISTFPVGEGDLVFLDGDTLVVSEKTPTQLTLQNPVTRNYTAGTTVCPMFTGNPRNTISGDIPAIDYLNTRLTITDVDALTVPAWDGEFYKGKPLLLTPSYIAGGASRDYTIESRDYKNARDERSRYVLQTTTRRSWTHNMHAITRDGVFTIYKLLMNLSGRHGVCWLPSQFTDYSLVTPDTTGQTTVRLTNEFEDLTVGDSLLFEENGGVFAAEIINMAGAANDEIDVTLDTPLTFDITSPVISRLVPMRLSTDSLELHFDRVANCRVTLNFIEVINESL